MQRFQFLKGLILFLVGAAAGYLLAPPGVSDAVGGWKVEKSPEVPNRSPAVLRSPRMKAENFVPMEVQPALRVPLSKAEVPTKPEGGPYIAVSELATLMGDGWTTKESESAVISGPMVEGIRHGETTVRFQTSDKYEVGSYFLGARHGKWAVYNAEGVLLQEHTYFGGKKNGNTRFRGDANDPWLYITYKDDEIVEDAL